MDSLQKDSNKQYTQNFSKRGLEILFLANEHYDSYTKSYDPDTRQEIKEQEINNYLTEQLKKMFTS